jgi:hypothetical protein
LPKYKLETLSEKQTVAKRSRSMAQGVEGFPSKTKKKKEEEEGNHVISGQWIEPEINMLSEINQIQKGKYLMFSLMWNLGKQVEVGLIWEKERIQGWEDK